MLSSASIRQGSQLIFPSISFTMNTMLLFPTTTQKIESMKFGALRPSKVQRKHSSWRCSMNQSGREKISSLDPAYMGLSFPSRTSIGWSPRKPSFGDIWPLLRGRTKFTWWIEISSPQEDQSTPSPIRISLKGNSSIASCLSKSTCCLSCLIFTWITTCK